MKFEERPTKNPLKVPTRTRAGKYVNILILSIIIVDTIIWPKLWAKAPISLTPIKENKRSWYLKAIAIAIDDKIAPAAE